MRALFLIFLTCFSVYGQAEKEIVGRWETDQKTFKIAYQFDSDKRSGWDVGEHDVQDKGSLGTWSMPDAKTIEIRFDYGRIELLEIQRIGKQELVVQTRKGEVLYMKRVKPMQLLAKISFPKPVVASKSQLIGTWEIVEYIREDGKNVDPNGTYSFAENGNLSVDVSSIEMPGKWRFTNQDSALILDFSDQAVLFVIVEISSESLTLKKGVTGHTLKFTKI